MKHIAIAVLIIAASFSAHATCREHYKKALAAYNAQVAIAKDEIVQSYQAAKDKVGETDNENAANFLNCHKNANQNYRLNIASAKNNTQVLEAITRFDIESKECGTNFKSSSENARTQFNGDILQAQDDYNARIAQARLDYEETVKTCP